MSQFGHRGGGGQHFSKLSQNKKCPKDRRGGGNPNWDIVQNFLDFLFWHLPLGKISSLWLALGH